MADETMVKGKRNSVRHQKEEMIARSEVERIVAKAVEEALASARSIGQPQTIVLKESAEEMVTLLYMGVVAENSTVPLGKLGEIQGRGGTRDIPKKEFFQNITPAISQRLKDRRLIIISGLTDEERERYGVNYTEGELISKDIYYKLLSMKEEDVLNIFKKACFRHKQVIVTLYMDAYVQGDNRINQPFIQKLNEVSKEVDKDGMFKGIIKDMIAALNETTNGE